MKSHNCVDAARLQQALVPNHCFGDPLGVCPPCSFAESAAVPNCVALEVRDILDPLYGSVGGSMGKGLGCISLQHVHGNAAAAVQQFPINNCWPCSYKDAAMLGGMTFISIRTFIVLDGFVDIVML